MEKSSNNDLYAVQEAELENLRILVAQKREYVAVLELELFNTRAELDSFNAKLNAHIVPLEHRANELREKLDNALAFKRYAKVNGRRESNGNDKDNGRDQESCRTLPPKSVDPETMEVIKCLFRGLAKRFHPDLTNDKEEKLWRQEIMTQVNQAYTDWDLETLETLSLQPDRLPKDAPLSREKEITQLNQELEHLDNLISELKREIMKLDQSPAMQLKMEITLARQNGRDLLSDMVAKLEDKIRQLEQDLERIGAAEDVLRAEETD
jgi:hypothetical protein